jgi:predicted amidohydrolase YtcJ
MRMQQNHLLTSESEADVILKNGRIATMDAQHAFVSAVAIKDGRVTNEAIFAYQAATTQVIDAGGANDHPLPQ